MSGTKTKTFHTLASNARAATTSRPVRKRFVLVGARSWSRTLPSLQKTQGATISHARVADGAANGSVPKTTTTTRKLMVDESHFTPLGSWSSAQIRQSRADHPYLMTWVPGRNRSAVPTLTHGHGVYVYDDLGKRYLDWTSQAVCANLGHSVPGSVVEATLYQMRTLPYTYGGVGVTEVRVRLIQLLNELLPGDLRAAVFPSSGAEANEAAIMAARRYTGRPKIMSWYRSYHGATAGAGAATGDYRRWYHDNNPGGGLFIKAFNPFPLFFNHAGDSEAERVQSALSMLEEQILNEGPDSIASLLIEPIVGAGGCLIMPPGYMQGIRAMCDKYGILLHVDEVMVGFGRTGHLFGIESYENVLPDILTAAKGLSGSFLPISMMACSGPIMDYFEHQPLGWGSTYQAHPVAMAAAYEVVKYLVRHDVVGHVQSLAPLFAEEMQRLANDHPSIKQFRAIGLFGCFDVHDTAGNNPKLQHEGAAHNNAFAKYKLAFADNGLVGIHRYPHIHCAPPLVINEAEMRDGFQRLDRALYVLDDALGFPATNAACTGSEAVFASINCAALGL